MLSNLLVIGNNKGGAKKSTLAAELAGEMWGSGWKVLLVDLDEQGDLGKRLFWRGTSVDDQGESLFRTMLKGDPLTSRIRAVGGRTGLDAIPGGEWAQMLSSSIRGGGVIEYDLEQILQPLAPEYDVIIVDTQPSLSDPLHLQALNAAHFVLTPLNRDEEDSVDRYRAHVKRIVAKNNPSLVHLGTVTYNIARGRKDTTSYLARLAARTGIRAYTPPIHNAPTAVSLCRLAQRLVHEYAVDVEKALTEHGSSYGVSRAGLNVTVAGKVVSKNQRQSLPDNAPLVGDVLLGGGLAGDYYQVAQQIMSDISQHLSDADSTTELAS